MFTVLSGGGWNGASGNNSPFMQKILKDKRLKSILHDWMISSEEERKQFEFIEYDDGTVDIIDHRSKETKE